MIVFAAIFLCYLYFINKKELLIAIIIIIVLIAVIKINELYEAFSPQGCSIDIEDKLKSLIKNSTISWIETNQDIFSKSSYFDFHIDNEIIDEWVINGSAYDCEMGSEIGENVNYWYCKEQDIYKDKILLENTTQDSDGTIQEQYRKEITKISFDNKFNVIEIDCRDV